MATLTGASNTFSKNNSILSSASISSCLVGGEGAFVPNFSEPIQNPSPIIYTPKEQYLYLGRKTISDGEIGIFEAEKYFNEGMDNVDHRIAMGTTKYSHKKDEERAGGVVDPAARLRILPGTLSIRSESSYNSQSTLLQRMLRNPSGSKSSREHGKSFLANLGCKYCCSNQKSVDIEDPVVVDEKLNAKTVTKVPIKTNEDQKEEDEKWQKSLGVFGSPVLEHGNDVSSFERRLNMYNWDGAQKVDGTEIPATSNDTESDESSDLFEIESFSSKLNQRRALEDTSGCITPTTCYTPSEASIAWSVVTASAVDYSAASDYEEQRPVVASTNSWRTVLATTTTPRNMGREVQRRRSSSLLGCKSHKAVNVAGSATRASERENSVTRSYHHSSEPFKPVTRVQAESKMTGLGSRQGQRDFATRPQHLYIQ